MLIKVSELIKFWKIYPRSVLHIGAHLAEEAEDYENAGWLPVIWVESQPALSTLLKNKLNSENHKVVNATVWNESGLKKTLKVTSNSQSSSLFEFGTHKNDYPTINVISTLNVDTVRVDDLFSDIDFPDFVSLDIQGAEGPAIEGFGNLINKVNFVYTEVNFKEVYVGCTLIGDLDHLLDLNGFKRVFTRKVIFKGWGDAIYIRKSLVNEHKNFSLIPLFLNFMLNLKFAAVKLKSIGIFLRQNP